MYEVVVYFVNVPCIWEMSAVESYDPNCFQRTDMTTPTQSPILSDAQMAERLKKAIERNNNINNREIRVNTEAEMADKAAKAEAQDALVNYDVKSLPEFREKTKQVYEMDVALLEKYEREVAAREEVVAAAEKILAEASGQ